MPEYLKGLRISPITFSEAREYIEKYHRHHWPPQGHKFSLCLEYQDKIYGVACVGNPVARGLDNGYTAEVTRLCTNGVANGCSMLYSACARASQAMGYDKIITYILATESGISLRAVGWTKEALVKGRSWSCQSRVRVDNHPIIDKIRYARILK